MSRPLARGPAARFARGEVVTRGHRYGVVWSDDGQGLVLLPIERPQQALPRDVTLDLSDLLACGAAIDHAVIRAAPIGPVAAAAQRRVGEVPDQLMRRVVQEVMRVAGERAALRRWAGHSDHRKRARVPGARLHGA